MSACSPPAWQVRTQSDPVPDTPSIIVDPIVYRSTPQPGRWLRILAVGSSAAALCVLGTTAYMRVAAESRAPAPPPLAEDVRAIAPLQAEPDPVVEEVEVAQAVEIDAPGASGAVEQALPEAVAAATPDFRAEVARGHKARRRGRLDEALSHYESALDVRPQHAPALAGLARIHVLRKQPAKALKLAERAVARAPRAAAYQLTLGDALRLSGQQRQAEQAYRLAEQLGSKRATSRLMAGVPNNPY